MLTEIKTISLALAFIFPLAWAITFFFTGYFKQRSKFFLFLVMIASCFTFFMTFLKFQGHIEIYAILFPVQAGVSLSLFPLFFIYLKSITSAYQFSRKRFFIHGIIPMGFVVSITIFQKFLIAPENEIKLIEYLLDYPVVPTDYFKTAKSIYFAGKLYFVLSSLYAVFGSYRTVRNHYLKMKEIFSENDTSELYWLKVLGIIFFCMFAFFVIIHTLSNSTVANNDILITISFLTFAIFSWYLGLNGFRQKEIYHLQTEKLVEFEEQETKITKEQLTEYLNKTKPYKNPEITAFDFCYHFHTNRTYLSESIRKSFNLNFRGLINLYRVNEAKDLIDKAAKNNYSIELEDIAEKSGFSSYSTFFRVFRAETGITPSDYLKSKSE
jgi:AraC-like DNA-binding protein